MMEHEFAHQPDSTRQFRPGSDPGCGAEFPNGDGRLRVDLGTTAIDVFTYRPQGLVEGPLVMVFHGVLRNAETYRDHARAMADRLGVLIAAPLFDQERFPTRRYQQGGVLENGVPLPRAAWTFSLLPPLIEKVRAAAGSADRPVSLLGHSGGGQFLARLTGFMDLDVRRIVAANPGTHLFLNREDAFPLGFGGLPAELTDDDAFRRCVKRPLTLYLGTGDTQRDENLDQSAAADRQGMNRYERGRRAYFRAHDLARERGWEFGWRLVEAPGVPHDHEQMFNHAQCRAALDLPARG